MAVKKRVSGCLQMQEFRARKASNNTCHPHGIRRFLAHSPTNHCAFLVVAARHPGHQTSSASTVQTLGKGDEIGLVRSRGNQVVCEDLRDRRGRLRRNNATGRWLRRRSGRCLVGFVRALEERGRDAPARCYRCSRRRGRARNSSRRIVGDRVKRGVRSLSALEVQWRRNNAASLDGDLPGRKGCKECRPHDGLGRSKRRGGRKSMNGRGDEKGDSGSRRQHLLSRLNSMTGVVACMAASIMNPSQFRPHS